mgnify:CR=1 FL=1
MHLGILIDVNMEVGLCHPPVGLNLYVGGGIGMSVLNNRVVNNSGGGVGHAIQVVGMFDIKENNPNKKVRRSYDGDY